MIAADENLAVDCYWCANCGLWEAAMAADATTLDEYWIPENGWSVDPPFVDDVYQPALEPYTPTGQLVGADLIECADGRKRTAAERAAWLDAIHASIRDAATS